MSRADFYPVSESNIFKLKRISVLIFSDVSKAQGACFWYVSTSPSDLMSFGKVAFAVKKLQSFVEGRNSSFSSKFNRNVRKYRTNYFHTLFFLFK